MDWWIHNSVVYRRRGLFPARLWLTSRGAALASGGGGRISCAVRFPLRVLDKDAQLTKETETALPASLCSQARIVAAAAAPESLLSRLLGHGHELWWANARAWFPLHGRGRRTRRSLALRFLANAWRLYRWAAWHCSRNFSSRFRKNAISDSEGRKRSHPESVYSGFIDRAFPLSSVSLESPCLIKMFGKEIVSERPDKARDDEIMLSMHRPPRPTSLVLHPPLSSRPDLSSKLEQSLSRSPGQLLHASCFSKATISSSYMNKDASAVATVISQSSIDEGSRTNIKASGVASISNPVSVVCEKKSTEFLPRPKASHATESETSNAVRRSTAASPGRQMTIFYSGQAHVFDNVHPNKADVILALAGSNGISWSTTYLARSSDQSIVNGANLPVSVHGERSQNHQIAEIPPPSDHSAIGSGGKDVGEEGCA
ncbi:hypothetical protein OPV22_028096 [Ensete ventricosum]|uniref:Protein TIFY n=1 Tax=Ensete ventricosum TaxID=4639 RepID=A0AAV8Q2I2_ENSVE|nr:hypothetical protein OPV22_028096 [Ensete ventricosum]